MNVGGTTAMVCTCPKREGLRDSKGIEQTETGTATSARRNLRGTSKPEWSWAESVDNRGCVSLVRYPVERLRTAGSNAQHFLPRPRAER